jgi:hypothetical protein
MPSLEWVDDLRDSVGVSEHKLLERLGRSETTTFAGILPFSRVFWLAWWWYSPELRLCEPSLLPLSDELVGAMPSGTVTACVTPVLSVCPPPLEASPPRRALTLPFPVLEKLALPVSESGLCCAWETPMVEWRRFALSSCDAVLSERAQKEDRNCGAVAFMPVSLRHDDIDAAICAVLALLL